MGLEYTAVVFTILFSIATSALLGSYMGSLAETKEVARFVEDGRLKVVLDSALPLQEAAKAHERLEKKDVFGKIVLAP